MIDIKNIASDYFSQVQVVSQQINLDKIQEIANVLFRAYEKHKNIFLIGNGGSAATASHLAVDLGKGTLENYYNKKEKRLRVISLTDNVATMTAVANDLSYEDLFVEQLHNLLQPEDVLIAITGSGNSANIIKALTHAKSEGLITVGFLGSHYGGRAKEFCDFEVTVQSNHQGIIEDIHLSLGHLLTDCLKFMKQQENKKDFITNGIAKVKTNQSIYKKRSSVIK